MIEYIKNMRKHIGHERLLYVGACVFVHKEGKKKKKKRLDNGFWCSAGGGTELGETVEEMAKRELLEETGLTANSLELLGVFSGKELFYTYPNGDMVSNVSVAYLCEGFTGELKPETTETADLQWFSIDDLPADISPPDKPALIRCVEVLKERVKKQTSNDLSIKSVDAYRDLVNRKIADSWSGPYVVSKSVLHDTRTHCGFVALENSEVIGFVLYHLADGDCEITVLESVREGRGAGKALIREVFKVADAANCRRVWLVTTNDNTHAIRFYQRFGFTLRGVHINAMDEARKLKPQIPLTGNDDIPIAHEFEFELIL
jgi:8-oxo-dGTP pyrophosphatase MutT (NUDIX family)/ribosomal protein S18 acetylase RimI-like enzyme